MAWNEIPARDDANLSFQAYYGRINILYSLLRPTSRFVFDQIWESAERSELKEFKKSALVGLFVADLVRALGLKEITECEPEVGDWFVHSGVTSYCKLESGLRAAEIEISGRIIRGAVRADCYITGTAAVNMDGRDDISFVVGRLTSYSKFDLVAAGYREPVSSLAGLRQIDLRVDGPSGVADLAALSMGDAWSSKLLQLEVRGVPDQGLLNGAVLDTVARFQSAVEDQGGWKLLYDDSGKVMHERQHQGMFRMFSRLTFGTLGIQMDANSDHGSGPTDFTLRLNKAAAIIEFKKDDKLEEIRHGVLIQLPIYMRSSGIAFGFYIVMCHKRDPGEIERILSGVVDADPTLAGVTCVVVDCRRRISASKAPARSALAAELPD
ncbi:hypothetical protein [Kitasatospora sp. CB02891]|uniref:hypothetical protein n=1 Tax=Kitasatospora sp. CB02891 TaxID=2020329 RepID=UPI0012FDF23C|nr:hypothetical protein [Kitasatospora sp. CB02891]